MLWPVTRRLPPDDRAPDAAASAGEAINLQLYRRLVSLIATGHWGAGSRLPSSRKLAADTGVSRTTANLALDRLVADGWAVARPRSGLFAAAGTPSAIAAPLRDRQPGTPPVPFELSQGAVDCFPHARWAKLQSRVWSAKVPDALYEPRLAGDPGLRSSIARHLLVSRGIQCSSEDLLVVASTRAALAIVAATLAGEVDCAAVEDPGYWRGADALSAAGLPTRPVPVDREGLRVEALGDAIGEQPALLYATPTVQFPTGAVLASERRRALADWCLESGNWLFEDDYDWDARFDLARPPEPLRAGPAADRIFYCQSFSRTMFSSFRLAALVVPPAMRERVLTVQERVEGFSNLAGQLVLREFIDSGGYAAHLRELRRAYAERREALLSIVRPYLGSVFEAQANAGGLRLVLRCPPAAAARLAARLREEGILCSTLGELSAGGVSDDGIVLGFAAFPPDVISACREPIARAMEGRPR